MTYITENMVCAICNKRIGLYAYSSKIVSAWVAMHVYDNCGLPHIEQQVIFKEE